MDSTINLSGVQDFAEALRPAIRAIITEELGGVLRTKRGKVVSAPASGKIGVQFPYDDSTHSLPYASICSSLAVGEQCIVAVVSQTGANASNMVVIQNGTWTL